LSQLGSRNKKLVGEGISELSRRMGFRCIDGFAERVVYREFFPRGLTALDNLDETTLGTRPNMSHVTAREEVIALLNALHLPLSENGRRRAAAPPPAPNGTRSWTSRSRSTTSWRKAWRTSPSSAPMQCHC
jgi:chromosome partitioning protein